MVESNKNTGFYPIGSKGFTLIEVIMVLAISSLLALILLGGYQETQKRERFRDSVERTVTLLEQTKNEANATVNVAGDGDTAGRLVFAKAVIFTDGSSDIEVVTLSAADREVLSGIRQDDSRTVRIPWQVEFAGASSTHKTVVFTRSVVTGQLDTYVLSTDNVTDVAQYVDTAAAASNTSAIGEFVLTDPFDGFLATVRVNAETNEVMRSYDN